MKKGIIILLVLTLVFTVFATVGNKESIVICSSAEQFRNDELQRQLNERFPDKNIIVTYMSTGMQQVLVLWIMLMMIKLA